MNLIGTTSAILVSGAIVCTANAEVVYGDIRLDNSEQITIDPGSVVGELTTWDLSHAWVYGGAFSTWISTEDHSKVDVYGGQIDAFLRSGFSYPWIPDSGAVISLYGDGFSVDGVSVPVGCDAKDFASVEMYEDSNGHWHPRYYGELAGVLSDGTPINTDFEIFQSASIVFMAPEPSMLASIVVGGLVLLRRTR